MRKRVFIACGGWILTELLLILTAAAGHLPLVWSAAGTLAGLVLLTWGFGFYIRKYLETEIQMPVTADKRQKKTGTFVVANHSSSSNQLGA